ncbi:MAG: T9SS type A sorting domain-containing protein [Flavobacteriia bacterium]|nr:T9SS type A sorting domain-containing protein [Flavobacteriia bacterium]
MKKKLVIAFWLLGGAMLYGQTDQLNLEKYWKLRNSFREKFVKIGTGPGASLPIGSINPNSCTAGAAQGYQNIYADMHWGDGMIRQGQYLQLLATEYRLLKNNGLDTRGTLNEIYYALQAINRCDLKAEPTQSKFYFPLSQQVSSSLNGYYLREDVPEDFGKDNWGETPLKPRCIDSDYYNNRDVSKTQVKGPQEHNEPSLDQLTSLMVGFSMIHKLVDNEYVQPTPQDPIIQIITETQAIVTRIVTHMSYNNWFMLNLKEWPVTNGGGDASLMAYPILLAAYRITGNYTFPKEFIRKDYFGYLKLIQPCLTGYGEQCGPESQISKCFKLGVENASSPFSMQAQAKEQIQILGFKNWENTGEIIGLYNSSESLWNITLPALATTGPDWYLNPNYLSNPILVELHPTLTFLDTTNKIPTYAKTILYNLATSAAIWNKTNSKLWADTTGNYSLELINAILRNETPASTKEFIRNLLNTMGPEGAYHVEGTDGYINENGVWVFASKIGTFNSNWKNDYKWNASGGDGFGAYRGIFNNIDYLLMHNLYYLCYNQDNLLPKYQEETNCSCSNSTISVTSNDFIVYPNIEILPSMFINNVQNATTGSIQDINNKLSFLEPCTPNVFASVNNIITGIFDVDNHFAHYKDIQIFDTKIQTQNASVESGSTLNIWTNFVICNDKTLQVKSNSIVNIERGTFTLKSGAILDISGKVRIVWNTKLQLKPGSKIILRPGATLLLEAYGKLITNEGSTIEYYDGGAIQVRDSQSEIILSGEIKLMNATTFKIIQDDTNYGLITFSGNPKFTALSSSKIELKSKNKTTAFIKLTDNTTLKIDDPNITDFDITFGMVEMKTNSEIIVYSKTKIGNVTMFSSTPNKGLTVTDASTITMSDVNNIPIFAKLNIENIGKLNLYGSQFNNNNLNTWSGFVNLVTVEGMGYVVNSCKFFGDGKTGIKSTNMTFPSSVFYSEFKNVNSNSTINGIEDWSSIEIYTLKSIFTDVNFGLLKLNGKATLSCNTFNCNRAIYASNCFLNMSTEDRGGYNVFNCTGSRVIELRTCDINLKKGYNKFNDVTNQYYIYGTSYNNINFNFGYLDFTYNQWNTSNTVPNITKFSLKYPSNNVSYSLNFSPTYLLPNCWAMGGSIPNPPAPPTTETTPRSVNFVPLITFYTDTIAIDSALIIGMNKMTFYNESGNNLEAIEDFNEIFSNNYTSSNQVKDYYFHFTISQMKTALESAINNQEIMINNMNNTYENHIQMYANALMKMTDSIIDSTNYNDQFNNELNKAHLFRVIQRSDIGYNILNELEYCGLDSLEQLELNYWKKEYSKDLEIIEIGFDAIDSLIIIDTINYQIPTDLEINQYHFGAEIQNINNILYPNCNYFEKAELSDIENFNEIIVYPNPSINEINFKIDIIDQKCQIEFYSNDGRKIHENNYSIISNNIRKIDISTWKNGIYHYKITLQSGEVKLGQFTISK